MKRVLFFLALLFCIVLSSFSQKIPPQDKTAEQEMMLKSKNGYTLQFTNMRILFADSLVKEFMSKKMNMVFSEDSKKELGNRVFKYYTLYTSRKNIEDQIKFEYTIRPGGSFFYIKELMMYGDLDDVVKFYNLFWEQSAKKADVRNGDVITSDYLKDKISLSYNTTEKKGFIKIIP